MALLLPRTEYEIVDGPGTHSFQQHFMNKFQRKAENLHFTIKLNFGPHSKLKGRTRLEVRIDILESADNSNIGLGECFDFQGRCLSGDAKDQLIYGHYDSKSCKGWLKHMRQYSWPVD